jgi:hypothetical protein
MTEFESRCTQSLYNPLKGFYSQFSACYDIQHKSKIHFKLKSILIQMVILDESQIYGSKHVTQSLLHDISCACLHACLLERL